MAPDIEQALHFLALINLSVAVKVIHQTSRMYWITIAQHIYIQNHCPKKQHMRRCSQSMYWSIGKEAGTQNLPRREHGEEQQRDLFILLIKAIKLAHIAWW